MFKPIYEYITEVFGKITGNTLYDFIIVALISQILFLPAFRIVGDMYKLGMIESKAAGSFFHWLIRGIFFIILVVFIGLGYHAYLFIKGIF